ncbi:bacterio-opsin activator domain-containing protein [Halobaculum sp. MBLA0147]|uniref:bacterio-opsin activator domain-containing protein n=1 Tax=Halobaculum sp. MBLA0147 TaxID=3079934 RepID=UPI0035246121
MTAVVTGGTDRAVEVGFVLRDRSHPFVGVTAALDCELRLRRLVPRGPDRCAQYVELTGADPERAEAYFAEAISGEGEESGAQISLTRVTLLERREDGGLFEFVTDDRCPLAELCRLGGVPTSVVATDGYARIDAEVTPARDPEALIAAFRERYDAELTRKCRREDATVATGDRGLRERVVSCLTDRQRDVLFAAFEAGYFDSPRRISATELADRLDIAAPTLHEHLRTAERKLVAHLADARSGLDGHGPVSTPGS